MEKAADTGAFHLSDTPDTKKIQEPAPGSFSSGFSEGFDTGDAP